eukprot:TRINITY_DN1056_c0_g1_i3.p1 TRINITY_DN1056_c0_g1~~TRINITY_DN1056_c0_g1_i3.p1  ORF type:complete len:402 (-),score=73.96 TRINITY_DN1056_c0_g1_i3:4144-5349(-)
MAAFIHPSLQEQEDELRRISGAVNQQFISELLRSLNMCFIHMSKHESEGVINEIFFVTATNAEDDVVELVLRIANPHTFSKRRKTCSEVAVMNYVRSKTNLPVPRVLSYAADSSSSILGCEYILMEKLPGVLLKTHKQQLSKPEKQLFWSAIVDIMAELHRLHEPHWDRIGSFDENMNVTTLLGDRPPLGPFASLGDQCLQTLDWVLQELGRAPHLAVYQDAVSAALCTFRDTVLVPMRNSELEQPPAALILCHRDLHAGNILIDREAGTITGLLDWEHACITTKDWDWSCLQDWAGEPRSPQRRHLTGAAEQRNGMREPPGFERRRHIWRLVDSATWMAYYNASWFLKHGDTFEQRAEILKRSVHQAAVSLQRHLQRFDIPCELPMVEITGPADDDSDLD